MHKPRVAVDPRSPSESETPEIIAAVDLGSNSFHMIVGELRHGQLTVIDRIRETVRLAEGLSRNGDLESRARQRALDCLSRFGERLREMHASKVRAAGTSTLRRAREDSTFMADAEESLGHPIEVISGIEEARLVYSGVTHSMPPTAGLRLVTDIGGGSTEVILGMGATPRALESLHLGCVSTTERFFADGAITARRFQDARMAARLELRPVKAFFRNAEDVQAIGTSGTIRAAERVAQSLGLVDTGVTPAAVEALIDQLLEFQYIDAVAIDALSERRAQVWPGGLVILAELLRALHIESMSVSDGALREGLLYDLLGRLQFEDARERTVQAMESRYNVDSEQATRVANTATQLLEQCAASWSLDDLFYTTMLVWAARLHEIGLDISHDGYHRHGAYIAEHADMPGFPRDEQRLLSVLIGGQRHRVTKKSATALLPADQRVAGLRLLIILRLAVLLNRSRSSNNEPAVDAIAEADTLTIQFDAAWLAENPLTVADLDRERRYLSDVGYQLAAS